MLPFSLKPWCFRPNFAWLWRTTITQLAVDNCPNTKCLSAWTAWKSTTVALKILMEFSKHSRSTWLSCLSLSVTNNVKRRRTLWPDMTRSRHFWQNVSILIIWKINQNFMFHFQQSSYSFIAIWVALDLPWVWVYDHDSFSWLYYLEIDFLLISERDICYYWL